MATQIFALVILEWYDVFSYILKALYFYKLFEIFMINM